MAEAQRAPATSRALAVTVCVLLNGALDIKPANTRFGLSHGWSLPNGRAQIFQQEINRCRVISVSRTRCHIRLTEDALLWPTGLLVKYVTHRVACHWPAKVEQPPWRNASICGGHHAYVDPIVICVCLATGTQWGGAPPAAVTCRQNGGSRSERRVPVRLASRPRPGSRHSAAEARVRGTAPSKV